MMVFYRSGLADEKVVLAEVVECEWPSGYREWVYEMYPRCFRAVRKLGELDVHRLTWNLNELEVVGSLPGVKPVYAHADEKQMRELVNSFFEALQAEKEEEEKRKKSELEKTELAKRKKEELAGMYKVRKVYRIIHPNCRKERDGYWDGLLENAETGKKVRMVARNVFDFGYYVYPKRVEGSEAVFVRSEWTKEERDAAKWLMEFPPISPHLMM